MSLLNNIPIHLLSKKESAKTAKQFYNWDAVKRILIIAADNQLSDVVNFLNECGGQNIKTSVAIIYNGKPELAPKPHFEHIVLNKKEFNFFGLPKQETINTLNNFGTELLINLCDEKTVKALALSRLISASCKMASFENNCFDITIDKTNTTNEFLKQVIVYLKMIKR